MLEEEVFRVSLIYLVKPEYFKNLTDICYCKYYSAEAENLNYFHKMFILSTFLYIFQLTNILSSIF